MHWFGAGFASGQEIYLFFYRFGLNGIVGIVICSLIISVIIFKAFKLICKNNIKTYTEFLEYIIENKKVVWITNISVNLFLCITFFIMVSGFGAYFKQEFRNKQFIG